LLDLDRKMLRKPTPKAPEDSYEDGHRATRLSRIHPELTANTAAADEPRAL
jgi:hypothetical protein